MHARRWGVAAERRGLLLTVGRLQILRCGIWRRNGRVLGGVAVAGIARVVPGAVSTLWRVEVFVVGHGSTLRICPVWSLCSASAQDRRELGCC